VAAVYQAEAVQHSLVPPPHPSLPTPPPPCPPCDHASPCVCRGSYFPSDEDVSARACFTCQGSLLFLSQEDEEKLAQMVLRYLTLLVPNVVPLSHATAVTCLGSLVHRDGMWGINRTPQKNRWRTAGFLT
jgi:hypothetical protein